MESSFKLAGDMKGGPIPQEQVLANIREGATIPLRIFTKMKRHGGTLVFIAGGPTLRDHIEEVRERMLRGDHLMTSNFTYDYLVEQGIVCQSCIVIDPTEQMADCIKHPHLSTHFYLGTVVTPALVRNLVAAVGEDHVTRVLTAYGLDDESDLNLQEELYKPRAQDFLVGGTMTPLRVMNLAVMMGYARLEYYGFDSCYKSTEPRCVYSDEPGYAEALARNANLCFKDAENPARSYVIDEPAEGGFYYAYKKIRNENVQVAKCADGRTFLTSPGFAHQAKQFIKWIDRLEDKLAVTVHGDSMNAHMLELHRAHRARLQTEIGDRRWTDHYENMQRQLHAEQAYGLWGDHDLMQVAHGCLALYETIKRPMTIMDYGAGSGALADALEALLRAVSVTRYDPFHPKWRDSGDTPGVHDIVTCSDVMEHVEIQCVENVIKFIAERCRYMAIFNIALEEAAKTLPDGRNAHITLRSPSWWAHRLRKHFAIVEAKCTDEMASFVLQKLDAGDHLTAERAKGNSMREAA